jgi:uncharacterized membrane protein YedE/YeeE
MLLTPAFAPFSSLAGGALIGAAASAKLLTTGRVTGISGIVGGAAAGAAEPWRLASIAGLAAGAATLSLAAPAAFQALPPTYTLTRAALAGGLVGAGSSLARGCTSGHGVCGLARASARSAAATGVFMATAALSARATGAFEAVGVMGGSGVFVAVAADPAVLQLGLAALTALAVGVAALKTLKPTPSKTLETLAEAATSAAFAVGLGVSGMLRPARVAAFFGPAASTPFWDPSLACVMAAALAVAAPAFQWASKITRRSLLGGPITLPTATAIDRRLLVGAAIFGAGWGAGGICPGPGVVAAVGAAGARGPYLVWAAAFAAAFVAVRKVWG